MLAQYSNTPSLKACPLLVDFRELFDYPSQLTISSWDQGIDWVLLPGDIMLNTFIES